MKQQRISFANIKNGMRVVVSDAKDTQLYTVKAIKNAARAVHLVYQLADGREVSGGWIDYGVCMTPSKDQLAARLVDLGRAGANADLKHPMRKEWEALRKLCGV